MPRQIFWVWIFPPRGCGTVEYCCVSGSLAYSRVLYEQMASNISTLTHILYKLPIYNAPVKVGLHPRPPAVSYQSNTSQSRYRSTPTPQSKPVIIGLTPSPIGKHL
jgi:hypothetical protein